MTTPVCVIGAGAGFAGDRVDPAVVLAASGVDAVVLECLAERTLVPAIRARRENPQAGFDYMHANMRASAFWVVEVLLEEPPFWVRWGLLATPLG